MNTLWQVLLWCPVSLLVACATTDTGQKPFYAVLKINAAPGNFQQFDTTIRLRQNGQDSTAFSTQFEKLQSDGQWAPVTGICVQGKDPLREQVCLNLAVSRDGVTVTPTRLERTSEIDAAPRRNSFPERPFGDGRFRIFIEIKSGEAKFSLDGTTLFSSAYIGAPERYAFFCSSAVCNTTIERVNSRDDG